MAVLEGLSFNNEKDYIMSIHLQSMAWKFSLSNSTYKQKSNIKLVLIKLCDNASDEGYCWPSMGRIAKECELSKRSVVDQINKLKDIGLIEVTHRFKDNEQTSNSYQINIELLSGGELLAPPSESLSLPQCTDCTQNHHLTINESSLKNTDISLVPKENGYFIDSLDKEDFKNCHEVMDQLNLFQDGIFYTGSLSIQEWIDCENAMKLVDSFNHIEYVWWWIQTRSKGFRKLPSLPNMLCDVNGISFEQFYETVFMQECE